MRKSDKDKEGLLYLNFQFSKPVSSKKNWRDTETIAIRDFSVRDR